MLAHLAQRHGEEDFGVLAVEARQPVGIEDDVEVFAYQAEGSGRKKPLSL
jgi:hypothetical protein